MANWNLNDAIEHLDETLSDKNHDWSCEECRQEHEQLRRWLQELKERREREIFSMCVNAEPLTMEQ